MRKLPLFSLLVLSSSFNHALGAAFALHEQNAALLGTFYAGSAAIAEDSSTNWYNSAALTQLDGFNFVASGVNVSTLVEFTGTTSLTTTGLPTSVETGEASGGTARLVPAMHASYKINDQWAVGMSAVVPFGLSTNYSDDSIVRYNATESELKTFNFSPSVAYQALDWLSFGAGFDAEYAEAIFDGVIGVSMAGFCGPDQDSCDSLSKNHATGWGFGWHAGMFAIVPQTGTHLGLNIHSSIEQDLSGTSKLEGPLNPEENESDLTTTADLPWWVVASVTHAFDERFTVLASLEYTHWSSIQELLLEGVETGHGSTSSADEFNFSNSWGAFLGFRYQFWDSAMLSFGGGYEETPTNDTDRELRLPDANRWIASVGLRYVPPIANKIQLDIGYAHVWGEEDDINKVMPSSTQTVTATGTVNAGVNILGAQITVQI